MPKRCGQCKVEMPDDAMFCLNCEQTLTKRQAKMLPVKKTPEAPTRIDLLRLSHEYPLVIVFHKSKSVNYPIALSFAKLCTSYAEITLEGAVVNCVAAKPDPSDYSSAAAIIRLAMEWKGTLVMSHGKVLPNRTISSILGIIDCYQDACSCGNYRANCFGVYEAPFDAYNYSSAKRIRYLFPCKRLRADSCSVHIHINTALPIPMSEQIFACGLSHGYTICPCFHPDEFRIVDEGTAKNADYPLSAESIIG